jgi:NAD(P)-dependent dehydrogenase (short-subunit alcohol dehydrogenase family)
MKNTPWTLADIPSQTGRLAIITGTRGLGYETAQAGGRVILAGRNETKGQESVGKILALHPNAKIAFDKLDLASLASVTNFASRFAQAHSSLDLLVNNAGVMTPPRRQTTADGFELQFGTNHLGHFAVTANLLPLLRRGHQPRVVNVSSGAHRLMAAIHFDDLQWERKYKPWPAYAQSKLANLLFTLELQRRSDANDWRLMVDAAHPGYARTELIPNSPGAKGFSWFINRRLMQPWMSHSPAEGALPTLFAATSPAAKNGGYYGPTRLFEMKGPPGPAVIGKKAKDLVVARNLWEVPEKLSRVRWQTLQ